MADYEIYNSDYTAEQIEDEIENGVPYINSTNKHWMRWDIDEQEYEDTGIYAEGSLNTSVNGLLAGEDGEVRQATASDVPSLDASKITSGTFADARIASASTWNAKQSKPTYDTTRSISSSSGWTNNTYTTLNTTYPFASYDIEVSISPDATSTQRDAYAEAMFTGHSDSNYITALGTKPTVDIPIVVKVWAK